jgi:hypothetical protein
MSCLFHSLNDKVQSRQFGNTWSKKIWQHG